MFSPVSEGFWDNREWDLDLPYDGSLGNKLSKIINTSSELTPENIDWWIHIEQKYQRDLIAEDRNITTSVKDPFINFFGVSGKISYKIRAPLKTLDAHNGF